MNFSNLFAREDIVTQPLFYIFVAFSALLGFAFFRGKRVNDRMFRGAFQDLIDVFRPVDQTFTNIGGSIGYHAQLSARKADVVEKVEATITFLPRQALLWMPISLLIRKYDRLFITLYLRHRPLAEGHLIEKGYAGFRGPKITNAARLQQEQVRWGNSDFLLYYANETIRQRLRQFLNRRETPGTIRHIALVPEEKKCFVFMIPTRGQVAAHLSPVYQWLPSVLKMPGK
ncbi:MAG TPA: hypothetical protein PLT63_05250 [Syntrophales bacterium]|nr:hypothetical protein [Syntrophales bacterium]